MTHKEESPSRIIRDADDRQSLHRTLLSCINPMDPDTHVTGSLLNIWSGQVAQPNVNVDRALDIGAEQMIQFERSWPDGFYARQRSYSAYMLWQFRLSVCLSVCPSVCHTGGSVKNG